MKRIIITVVLLVFLIIMNMLSELNKAIFADALTVSLGGATVSILFGWGLYKITLLILRRTEITDTKPKLTRFNYVLIWAIVWSILHWILASKGLW